MLLARGLVEEERNPAGWLQFDVLLACPPSIFAAVRFTARLSASITTVVLGLKRVVGTAMLSLHLAWHRLSPRSYLPNTVPCLSLFSCLHDPS